MTSKEHNAEQALEVWWNSEPGPRTPAKAFVAGYSAALAGHSTTRAQRCPASASMDPPQDCDAPFCGCNPAWTQCIEWLQEAGWEPRRQDETSRQEYVEVGHQYRYVDQRSGHPIWLNESGAWNGQLPLEGRTIYARAAVKATGEQS